MTVLVASDAMTRGMDVEGIANVVNYDAPVYAKTYVHRAGRTARAGRTGVLGCSTFCMHILKCGPMDVAIYQCPPAPYVVAASVLCGIYAARGPAARCEAA